MEWVGLDRPNRGLELWLAKWGVSIGNSTEPESKNLYLGALSSEAELGFQLGRMKALKSLWVVRTSAPAAEYPQARGESHYRPLRFIPFTSSSAGRTTSSRRRAANRCIIGHVSCKTIVANCLKQRKSTRG